MEDTEPIICLNPNNLSTLLTVCNKRLLEDMIMPLVDQNFQNSSVDTNTKAFTERLRKAP